MHIENSSSLQRTTDVERILWTLEDFAHLLYARGVSVLPYSPSSLHRLMGLSEVKRRTVMVALERFLVLAARSVSDGKVRGDDRYFIELCAQRLGLIFDKGVYDRIRPGDIVEIYNVDLVQIFRNFSFFDVCSYTLLDLLTYEFFELYERSHLINQYIFEATDQINSRGYDMSPLDLSHVPSHLMQEKFSEGKLTCMTKFKWMYPVYIWPQILYGYLVVTEGEVLNEIPHSVAFI